MKILLIYCNPNSGSFSNAIKNTVAKECQLKGHEIILRDLYEMNFDPILTISEFNEIKTGKIPSDIKIEHELIAEAGLLIVIYPLWWNGPPALLKGYFDRVFSYGFAYTYNSQGAVKLLTNKKVIIFTPNGTPKDVYEKNGRYDSISQTIDDGLFRFCGVEVVAHYYFSSGRNSTEPERKGHLEIVVEVVKSL